MNVETTTDPCDCKTLRAKVEELIRGELCGAQSAALRAHLALCHSCASEEDALQRLTAAVKRACAESAPESLRELILQQIEQLQSSTHQR